MKFQLVGSTSYAWPELLKEFPAEHLTALNTRGINVQSIDGFFRLLTAFETGDPLQTGQEREYPVYLLNFWQLTYWFELPFDLIEEVNSKSGLYVMNIPLEKEDINRGLLTASLVQWVAFAKLRGKPYVSQRLTALANIVVGLLERENLAFLLTQK